MGTSTQTEVLIKPILHIEARLKTFKDDVIIRTDQVASEQAARRTNKGGTRESSVDHGYLQVRDEITQWLVENFAVLSLGQDISTFGWILSQAFSLQFVSSRILIVSYRRR